MATALDVADIKELQARELALMGLKYGGSVYLVLSGEVISVLIVRSVFSSSDQLEIRRFLGAAA
jgi:hypothetical protein